MGQCLTIGNSCIMECEVIYETSKGNVIIGDGVYIGGGSKLISTNNIKTGNDVQISGGVTIYDHNGYSLDSKIRKEGFSKIFKDHSSGNMLNEFDWNNVKSAPIIIEDDVRIGFGATILKGVKIGQGAIIALQ
jgi:acetyltransferase-like isoleucine patch superfamily enzyme